MATYRFSGNELLITGNSPNGDATGQQIVDRLVMMELLPPDQPYVVCTLYPHKNYPLDWSVPSGSHIAVTGGYFDVVKWGGVLPVPVNDYYDRYGNALARYERAKAVRM